VGFVSGYTAEGNIELYMQEFKKDADGNFIGADGRKAEDVRSEDLRNINAARKAVKNYRTLSQTWTQDPQGRLLEQLTISDDGRTGTIVETVYGRDGQEKFRLGYNAEVSGGKVTGKYLTSIGRTDKFDGPGNALVSWHEFRKTADGRFVDRNGDAVNEAPSLDGNSSFKEIAEALGRFSTLDQIWTYDGVGRLLSQLTIERRGIEGTVIDVRYGEKGQETCRVASKVSLNADNQIVERFIKSIGYSAGEQSSGGKDINVEIYSLTLNRDGRPVDKKGRSIDIDPAKITNIEEARAAVAMADSNGQIWRYSGTGRLLSQEQVRVDGYIELYVPIYGRRGQETERRALVLDKNRNIVSVMSAGSIIGYTVDGDRVDALIHQRRFMRDRDGKVYAEDGKGVSQMVDAAAVIKQLDAAIAGAKPGTVLLYEESVEVQDSLGGLRDVWRGKDSLNTSGNASRNARSWRVRAEHVEFGPRGQEIGRIESAFSPSGAEKVISRSVPMGLTEDNLRLVLVKEPLTGAVTERFFDRTGRVQRIVNYDHRGEKSGESSYFYTPVNTLDRIVTSDAQGRILHEASAIGYSKIGKYWLSAVRMFDETDENSLASVTRYYDHLGELIYERTHYYTDGGKRSLRTDYTEATFTYDWMGLPESQRHDNIYQDDTGEIRAMIWTVDFVNEPTAIKDDRLLLDMFGNLPKEARTRLENIGVREDTPLRVAKKITNLGAGYSEYYLPNDIVGRKVVTQGDNFAIFSCEWSANGKDTRSYKVSTDASVIYEYKTSAKNRTSFKEFARDKREDFDDALRDRPDVAADLDKARQAMHIADDAMLDVVEETPWKMVIKDGKISHEPPVYGEDGRAETTNLLLMMPNDPQGRDIMRILPETREGWRPVIINKWWLEGADGRIIVKGGTSTAVATEIDILKKNNEGQTLVQKRDVPFGALPGRVLIYKEKGRIRVETRYFDGTSQVERFTVPIKKADGSVILRSYFRPAQAIKPSDVRSALPLNEGEEIIQDAEWRDLLKPVQEKAYDYVVDNGDLLINETLSKEGTQAMRIYKVQLFRLANGVFANLRYIPGFSEAPTGVITADNDELTGAHGLGFGKECVYYNMANVSEEPIFSVDMAQDGSVYKARLLRRWVGMKPNDIGGVTYFVKEVDPLTRLISMQEYKYDERGELRNKKRTDLTAEMDRTAEEQLRWLAAGAERYEEEQAGERRTFADKILHGDFKGAFTNLTYGEAISLSVAFILLGVPSVAKLYGAIMSLPRRLKRRAAERRKAAQLIEVRGLAVTAAFTAILSAAASCGAMAIYMAHQNFAAVIALGLVAGLFFAHAVVDMTVLSYIKRALGSRAGPIAKAEAGKILLSEEFEALPDTLAGNFVREYIIGHEGTHLIGYGKNNVWARILNSEPVAYLFPILGMFTKPEIKYEKPAITPPVAPAATALQPAPAPANPVDAFIRDFDVTAGEFSFDADTVASSKHTIERALRATSMTLDEYIKLRFREFDEWRNSVKLDLPAGVILGPRELVLYLLIWQRASHLRAVVPNWRFYLVLKALRLAEANKSLAAGAKIPIGRVIAAEVEEWYAQDLAFYKNPDLCEKKYRLTEENMEDMFDDPAFVRELIDNDKIITKGLADKINKGRAQPADMARDARKRSDVLARWQAVGTEINDVVLNRIPASTKGADMKKFEKRRDDLKATEIDPYKWREDVSGDLGNWKINGIIGVLIGLAISLPFHAGITGTILAVITMGGFGAWSSKIGLRGLGAYFKNFKWISSGFVVAFFLVLGFAFPQIPYLGLLHYVPASYFALAVAVIGLYALIQPIIHAAKSDKIKEPDRKEVVMRVFKEAITAVIFWGLVLGTKAWWNYTVFSWLQAPTLALLSYFAAAPFWGWVFVVFMWSPFVLFFFLDTFTFFELYKWIFGLFIGYGLGLGKNAYWSGAQEAYDAAAGSFDQNVWKESGQISNTNTAWKETWKAIVEQIYLESLLTIEERNAVIRGDLKALVRNEEARDRMLYYFRTVGMSMPTALASAAAWDKMKSFTACITAANEQVIYHLDGPVDPLNSQYQDNNLTKLTHLIMRHPDEWKNFIDRLQRENKVSAAQAARWRRLQAIEKFEFDIDLALTQQERDIVVEEVEDWANMRFQPVYRTVMGFVRVRDAYRLFAKACFPQEQEEGQADYESRINKKVGEKMQLLWAYQDYGVFENKIQNNTATPEDRQKYQDVSKLLLKYPELEVAYLTGGVTGKKYVEWDAAAGSNVIRNTASPAIGGIHKCYKPANQNNMVGWIWGDVTLFVDANCGARLEDAIKIPNMLAEFDRDPMLATVNVPEYIYTDKYNWIGQAHAFGDRTWTSFSQRVTARLAALGFYGHSAFFRTELLRDFGTIPPDYVSEDLMLAIKTWIKGRGYHISHKEYMQLGKAREVSVMNASVPFQKFAAGGVEMGINRQLEKLFKSREFSWYQKLTLFMTLCFYYKKYLVFIALPLYLVNVVFLGISGFSAFPLGVTLAFVGVWFSQMISFSGIGQKMLEKGILRGLMDYLGLIPTMLLLSYLLRSLGVTLGLSPLAFYAAMMATVFITSAAYWYNNVKAGKQAILPEMFGLMPKLIMVFIGYVPLYAIGVLNGLLGAAKFVLTKKDWELAKKAYSENVYNVVTSGKESYKLQIRIASVFLGLTTVGMYLFQSPALLFSFFAVTSIFFWMYSTIITMTGVMPATTGLKGLSGWKQWSRNLKNSWKELYPVTAKKPGGAIVKDRWFIVYDITLGAVIPILLTATGMSLRWENFELMEAIKPFLFTLPATVIGVFTTIWVLGSLYFLIVRSWALEKLEANIKGGSAPDDFRRKKAAYDLVAGTDPGIVELLLKRGVLDNLRTARSRGGQVDSVITADIWGSLEPSLKEKLKLAYQDNEAAAKKALYDKMAALNAAAAKKVSDANLDNAAKAIIAVEANLENLRAARAQNNNVDIAVTDAIWDGLELGLRNALLDVNRNNVAAAKKALYDKMAALNVASAPAPIPVPTDKGLRRDISFDEIRKGDTGITYSNGLFSLSGLTYDREAVALRNILELARDRIPDAWMDGSFSWVRTVAARLIPSLRAPPVKFMRIKNLGTNAATLASKDARYLLLDDAFISALANAGSSWLDVTSHIMAERLVHEFSHSADPSLDRDGLIAEEKLAVGRDLEFFRLTLADKTLTAHIAKFFAEKRPSFVSGGYFGSAEGPEGRKARAFRGLYLATLAAKSPAAAASAIDLYVEEYYRQYRVKPAIVPMPVAAAPQVTGAASDKVAPAAAPGTGHSFRAISAARANKIGAAINILMAVALVFALHQSQSWIGTALLWAGLLIDALYLGWAMDRYHRMGKACRTAMRKSIDISPLVQNSLISEEMADKLSRYVSIARSTIDYSRPDLQVQYEKMSDGEILPDEAVRAQLRAELGTRESYEDAIRYLNIAAFKAFESLKEKEGGRALIDLIVLHESFKGGIFAHIRGVWVMLPIVSALGKKLLPRGPPDLEKIRLERCSRVEARFEADKKFVTMVWTGGIAGDLDKKRIAEDLRGKDYQLVFASAASAPLTDMKILTIWGETDIMRYINDMARKGGAENVGMANRGYRRLRESLEASDSTIFMNWLRGQNNRMPDIRKILERIEYLRKPARRYMLVRSPGKDREDILRKYGRGYFGTETGRSYAVAELKDMGVQVDDGIGFKDLEKILLDDISEQDFFRIVVVGNRVAASAHNGSLRHSVYRGITSKDGHMASNSDIYNGIHCPRFNRLPSEFRSMSMSTLSAIDAALEVYENQDKSGPDLVHSTSPSTRRLSALLENVLNRGVLTARMGMHASYIAEAMDAVSLDPESFSAIKVSDSKGRVQGVLIATEERGWIDGRIRSVVAGRAGLDYKTTITLDSDGRQVRAAVFYYEVNDEKTADDVISGLRDASRNYRSLSSAPNHTVLGHIARIRRKDYLPRNDSPLTKNDADLAKNILAASYRQSSASDVEYETLLEPVVSLIEHAVIKGIFPDKGVNTVSADSLRQMVSAVSEEAAGNVMTLEASLERSEGSLAKLRSDRLLTKPGSAEREEADIAIKEALSRMDHTKQMLSGAYIIRDGIYHFLFIVDNIEKYRSDASTFEADFAEATIEGIDVAGVASDNVTPLTPLILLDSGMSPAIIRALASKWRIAGIATERATLTSHWVVFANNMGIPVHIMQMPYSAEDHTKKVRLKEVIKSEFAASDGSDRLDQKIAILSSDSSGMGELLCRPDMSTLEYYSEVSAKEMVLDQFAEKRSKEVITKDGVMIYTGNYVSLLANADDVEQARIARRFGARSVGLVRSEYQFAAGAKSERAVRDWLAAYESADPDIATAEEAVILSLSKEYDEFAAAMTEGEVSVRIIDFEPDKITLIHEVVGRINARLRAEGKPLIEYGFGLYRSDIGSRIVNIQLQALMRAFLGGRGNINVIFPMVSSPADRALAEKMVAAAIENTISAADAAAKKSGKAPLTKEEKDSMKARLGTMTVQNMIETAEAIDNIAALAVNESSIGSNDLSKSVMMRYLVEHNDRDPKNLLDRKNPRDSIYLSSVRPPVLEAVNKVLAAQLEANRANDTFNATKTCGEYGSWTDYHVAIMQMMERLSIERVMSGGRERDRLPVGLSMAAGRIPYAATFLSFAEKRDYRGIDISKPENIGRLREIADRIFQRIYADPEFVQMYSGVRADLMGRDISFLMNPPDNKYLTAYSLLAIIKTGGNLKKLPEAGLDVAPPPAVRTPGGVIADAAPAQPDSAAAARGREAILIETELTVVPASGIHVNPSAVLAKAMGDHVQRYGPTSVSVNNQKVEGVFGWLTLAMPQGTVINMTIKGPRAEELLEAFLKSHETLSGEGPKIFNENLSARHARYADEEARPAFRPGGFAKTLGLTALAMLGMGALSDLMADDAVYRAPRAIASIFPPAEISGNLILAGLLGAIFIAAIIYSAFLLIKAEDPEFMARQKAEEEAYKKELAERQKQEEVRLAKLAAREAEKAAEGARAPKALSLLPFLPLFYLRNSPIASALHDKVSEALVVALAAVGGLALIAGLAWSGIRRRMEKTMIPGKASTLVTPIEPTIIPAVEIKRDFVIGVPDGIGADKLHELRARVGVEDDRDIAPDPFMMGRVEVRTFGNVDQFTAYMREKGFEGAFIDYSYLDEVSVSDIIANLTLDVSRVFVGSRSRVELLVIIGKIKAMLRKIERADIDADARMALTRQAAAAVDKELMPAVEARIGAFGGIYRTGGAVNAGIEALMKESKPVAIALTGRSVENDLLSARGMDLVSRSGGAIRPFFIYNIPVEGVGQIATENAAREYLARRGYSAEAIAETRFVNGAGEDGRTLPYAEIRKRIMDISRNADGVNIEYVGIAATEKDGIIKEAADEGVLLEAGSVTADGRTFYATINIVPALLNVMAQSMAAEGVMVPGVIDGQVRGLFRYKPPVPIDYSEELEAFRKAMELIRSAA
jgi:phosphoenolpyruvate-protein kinase (PTS system EI component)/phosphotransferase system HPr-like phosphotransfer protein